MAFGHHASRDEYACRSQSEAIMLPVEQRKGKRWLQFRLRTALAVTLLASCVLAWYVIDRDIQAAHDKYDSTCASFEQGTADYEDVCKASMTVRDRECRMPFYSKRAAGAEHLVRVQRLHLQLLARIPVTMFGDQDTPRNTLQTVCEYEEEAEAWLEKRR